MTRNNRGDAAGNEREAACLRVWAASEAMADVVVSRGTRARRAFVRRHLNDLFRELAHGDPYQPVAFAANGPVDPMVPDNFNHPRATRRNAANAFDEEYDVRLGTEHEEGDAFKAASKVFARSTHRLVNMRAMLRFVPTARLDAEAQLDPEGSDVTYRDVALHVAHYGARGFWTHEALAWLPVATEQALLDVRGRAADWLRAHRMAPGDVLAVVV
jgi:hypothetical protein